MAGIATALEQKGLENSLERQDRCVRVGGTEVDICARISAYAVRRA